LLASTLLLTGCGAWWLPRAHKINIQQGNLLPPEAVSQIVAGMPRNDVVGLLGEPVVSSLINPQRWDYIYSINRSGETPNARRLTLFFENDVVSKLEKSGFE